MEDDDDLVPEVDHRGWLNISNRAWVRLEPTIFGMAQKLIKLDMSYNHINELPPQIGELTMLRELIASFNKIAYVPNEIGRLKRLKKLLLNSNRITILPNEVGNLEMLEDLVVSENSIEEIPPTIISMVNLKSLKLANNKLRTLPFELADVMTLEEIDCANNPDLDMVPSAWRGDTESVLFVCRIHRDYNVRISEMVLANTDLSKHSQFTEQDNMVMKEKISELVAKIDELDRNMPAGVKKRMEKERLLREEAERALIDEAPGHKGSTCVIC